MGSMLSSAAAASPVAARAAARTVPAAAHRADAISKAAVAKAASNAFPPMPEVASSSNAPAFGAPSPLNEREANRGIVDMLNQTSFVTRTQTTIGASSSSEEGADALCEAPEGVPLDTLLDALRLHGEDAARWDAPSLAQKYGIVDVQLLSDVLAHCRTYHIVEDEEGRARGLPIGQTLPSKEVQDLFKQFGSAPPESIGGAAEHEAAHHLSPAAGRGSDGGGAISPSG